MSIDLGPLYEPDAVRFSFETPGWYLVAGLLLIIAVLIFFRWLKHYRKNGYRRDALQTIARIEQNSPNQNDANQLNDIWVLLKLVAMESFGRQQVAQLYGNDWLEFLESTGKNTPFTDYNQYIVESLYDTIELDLKETKALVKISKQWISTHA